MNIFCILEDGETFSGVSNSTITIYPDDDTMCEEDLDLLNNGVLPENPSFVVSLDILLQQAIEHNLPCVSNIQHLFS